MKQELSIKSKYYRYFPFRSLAEKIVTNRTEGIVNSFDKFIKKGGEILDIGGGGGWIGREIRKRKTANVTLLDVIDWNQTDLKLVLYDGKKMPFSDNSFDAALLIFVLHHSENPLEVLKEAKRISKDKVIIIEDTYTSFFNKILLCIWDVISNLPVFFIKPFAEKMPFNFKRISKWEEVFEKFQLKIVFKKEYQLKKIIGRVLFVLEK